MLPEEKRPSWGLQADGKANLTSEYRKRPQSTQYLWWKKKKKK
jgi:hypothetical protein